MKITTAWFLTDFGLQKRTAKHDENGCPYFENVVLSNDTTKKEKGTGYINFVDLSAVPLDVSK